MSVWDTEQASSHSLLHGRPEVFDGVVFFLIFSFYVLFITGSDSKILQYTMEEHLVSVVDILG